MTDLIPITPIDVALAASAICRDVDDAIKTAKELEDQGYLPVVEAGDFLAALKHIQMIAQRLGGSS